MSGPRAPLVRAVLATNVLVRALVSRDGSSAEIIDGVIDSRFRLVTSASILAELEDVLRRDRLQRRTRFSTAEISSALRAVRRIADVVVGGYVDLDRVPTDPKDNHVVASAIEGAAAYLVTADRRDLLPLKVVRLAGYKPVQIVSPSAFLLALRRG